MSGITERLPRLLSLVPYLQAHPGVRVETAAAELGVSSRQLRKDLELLWMCGLPGYGPGELIDLSFEGDTISVVFDAGLDRPLRLSRAEAGALAVALRALADVGGLVGRDVVERTLAKVEAAAGGSTGPSAVAVGPSTVAGSLSAESATDESVASTTATLTDALAQQHPLRIRYYTASRDAVSEREVEPRQLLVIEGRSYLEAWCRRAEDVRMFRVDRIDDVTVLPERLPHVPAAAQGAHDFFADSEDLPAAVLELDAAHGWVAEYYPVEEVTQLGNGTLRVQLRYTDTDWLLRLVLGLGGGAHVVVPAALNGELSKRAREAIAAYTYHAPAPKPS